ncbi:MAG: hypothetical protein HOV94_22910 [Saccharothrix sp.]|nr:hypothetical protein [Saccharothrix sp.]
MGLRAGLVMAVVVGALAVGCTAQEPSAPGGSSAGMRAFDFGEAEWFDAMSGSTVRLAGGLAEQDPDPVVYPGGIAWRMLGPVAYTDIDGDGDEDAAAGLHGAGGQMFSSAWYLWLWQDGSAVQVRRPIAGVSRCEGPIESVTAKPGAISVRMLMTEVADTCAGGGAVPVTYDVGLRDGWPVRVAPEFGPIELCNPRDLTDEVVPLGEVQLRVAGDERAPAVGERVRYSRVLINEIGASPYLPGHDAENWRLALGVLDTDSGPRRVCGWARLAELH